MALRARFAPLAFPLTLLAIEFLDEFIYGASEAAWPLIRDDLGLSYVEIGLLLSIPGIASSLIEPFLGIPGDVIRADGQGEHRLLILGSGVVFAFSLLLTAASHSFLMLLISFVLFYPASGAFVGLSQATLMDADTTRHEQNMARWTFAGSIGVLVGPLVLSAFAWFGHGWRGLFLLFAALSLILLVVARRYSFAKPATSETAFQQPHQSFRPGEL